MNAPVPRSLCVFLSSSEDIDQRYFRLARDLGSAMCQRGISLVSGGGGISTMGELADAVRAGGGHTTGVIPARLLALDVGDTSADELIVTSDMRDRKAWMDRRSDAFLALPGGLGTLEELVEVWVARTLQMHRKPVVILDPWGDFDALRNLVEALHAARMVRRDAADDVIWCTSVEHALDAVEAAWARGEGRERDELGRLVGSVGGDFGDPMAHPEEWLEAD